jgi:GNAT superfamily N-acetyltransferase
MDVVIREATEEDLGVLVALYEQLASPGASLSRERVAALLRRIAEYPDYKVYVAEVGGSVVGTFALLIMDALGDRCQPEGIVEDVVVDQSARGGGVGRAMMELAMARCRERGCYKLVLSSSLARKKAHEFYEKLGFEIHGFSFVVRLDG